MALAFGGADASRTSGTGTSISWTSPTVSGSNTYGVVFIENTGGAGDTVTGVTWNGVAMTQATKEHYTSGGPTNKYAYVYVLAGVTTGTIVVSSSSTDLNGIAAYYTGAQTTTTPNAVAHKEATTSGNDALTFANSAGAWIIASHGSANANPTATWNSTERAPDRTDNDLIDSNGTVSANNASTGWTWGTSDHHIIVGVAILGAGTAYSSTLTETVVTTASVLKTATKVLSETVAQTATLLKTAARTFSEVIIDTASLLKTAGKVLVETLALTDTFTEGLILTSGPNSAGTITDDSSVGSISWTNPGNAASSDNSYAVAAGIAALSAYAGPNGTGVEDGPVKLVKAGVIGGTDLSTFANYPTADTYFSYGGSSNLWGLTWTPSDINDSGFGVAVSARETKFDTTMAHYLKATNFGFSIPSTATINGIKAEIELKADTALALTNTDAYVDHIRITVYYSLSGNLYTQTFTEVVATADTLIKAGTKLLAETFALTDIFIRSTSRAFSETITDTATSLQTTTRTLAETIATADTFAYLRTAGAVLTETYTLAETFIRSMVRTFSEAITDTDTLESARVVPATFSEVMTTLDTFVRASTKLLSEAVTMTASTISTVSRTLADTIATTDTFEGLRARVAVLTETISTLDTFIRSTTRTLSETISNTDTLTSLKVYARTLTETLSNTDSMIRTSARAILEAVTTTDTFSRVWTVVRTLTETLTLTDTIRKLRNGITVIWTGIAKVAASFTKTPKAASTWDNQGKGSNTWDNIDKP